MDKPMFFCIGAQKAGTTTLNDILRQNPAICLPREKETHFFSLPDKNREGVAAYFSKCFEPAHLEACRMAGEVDPSYCFFEGTAERIHKQLSPLTPLRFIFILRDPVRRAYSHYLMSCRRGFETLPFAEAVAREPDRIGEPFGRNQFSYIHRGYYHKQIETYFQYFDPSRFLFLTFEDDLIGAPEATLKRIHAFLGLPAFDYTFNLKSNPASQPRSELLRDAIFKDSAVKRLVKRLLPSGRFKKNIRERINQLNSRTDSVTPLSDEVYRQVWQTYYTEEVPRLKELTSLEFSSWNKT